MNPYIREQLAFYLIINQAKARSVIPEKIVSAITAHFEKSNQSPLEASNWQQAISAIPRLVSMGMSQNSSSHSLKNTSENAIVYEQLIGSLKQPSKATVTELETYLKAYQQLSSLTCFVISLNNELALTIDLVQLTVDNSIDPLAKDDAQPVESFQHIEINNSKQSFAADLSSAETQIIFEKIFGGFDANPKAEFVVVAN
ncbi:MAG: hypothetical protein AAGA53_12625 [Pseudomonadota bacterium]